MGLCDVPVQGLRWWRAKTVDYFQGGNMKSKSKKSCSESTLLLTHPDAKQRLPPYAVDFTAKPPAVIKKKLTWVKSKKMPIYAGEDRVSSPEIADIASAKTKCEATPNCVGYMLRKDRHLFSLVLNWVEKGVIWRTDKDVKNWDFGYIKERATDTDDDRFDSSGSSDSKSTRPRPRPRS